MTEAAQIPAEASARIRAAHQARASAELAAADVLAPGSDRVAWRGSVFASVALVKGLAGPAEAAGEAALSGADGVAAAKALTALGWDEVDLFFTLSRPEPGIGPERRAARLRMQLEAVDPVLAIALDAEAAEDLAAAFACEPLRFGVETKAVGRRLLAVDGLEASLADERRKREVWRQLKAAFPDGSVY